MNTKMLLMAGGAVVAAGVLVVLGLGSVSKAVGIDYTRRRLPVLPLNPEATSHRESRIVASGTIARGLSPDDFRDELLK